MIFDGLFNNKKKDADAPENMEAKNLDVQLPDAVKSALDAVLPKLNGSGDNLEGTYTPQEFSESISGADYDKLLVLAEYFFGIAAQKQKANETGHELYAHASAMIYAEIQKKLQKAERIYVLMDHCLNTEYPYIVDGDVFFFFDETRAKQWCALCSASAKKPLAVRAIENKDIGNIFVLMAIIGAEFVRFHPEINNLRIKRSDIYKCEVKTVSDSRVRFLMLSYVQHMNTSKKEQTKQVYAAMMGSIALDKFLIAGTEENEMFRAATIADTEKVVWVPLFTDELEFRHFLDTFPAIKPQFEKTTLKVISFTGLKGMLSAPEMGGVVINPADVGLRIKPDTCGVMIENVIKAQQEANKNQ
ncbi:MAG: hypothetical protein J6N52_11585 [Clostridia bacterium]|nr:hypothetical protein [Clostridia bacterium]